MNAPNAPETGHTCTLSAPAELPPVEVYADEAEALDDPFDVDEQGRIIFDDYSDTRDALNAVFGFDTFDPESDSPDETERIEAHDPETVRPDTAARWIGWAMRAKMPGATPKRRDTERRVLIYLAACVAWKPDSPRYGQCFPAVRTVAKETGASAGTVKSTLDSLRGAGLIEWNAPAIPERARGRNNAYTLRPAFGIAGQASLFTKTGETVNKALVQFSREKLNKACSVFKGKTEQACSENPLKTEQNPSKTHNPQPIRAGGRENVDNLPDPERPEIDRKAAGADQENVKAAAWLRKHGVRAVSLASVAETDPERFRRVREHVDGAGGQCGPGLIVQMLRGEADIPDAPAYTPPRMCRACASTYCRNVDATAPPCAAP